MTGDRRKERQAESRQTRAVIDRMEDGDMAVLLVGDDEETQVDIPASLLPEGASDSDHLIITISLDRKARANAEARVRKLQQELKGKGGAEDKKDFKL